MGKIFYFSWVSAPVAHPFLPQLSEYCRSCVSRQMFCTQKTPQRTDQKVFSEYQMLPFCASGRHHTVASSESVKSSVRGNFGFEQKCCHTLRSTRKRALKMLRSNALVSML